jgi:hypothetical protein
MTSGHVVVFEGLDARRKRCERGRAGRCPTRRRERPADHKPTTFTNLAVATYGAALNPNSSSARNPVTFWSNREPASDDTSMRNSEPM